MEIIRTEKFSGHKIIFAKNKGKLLYKGSPVCHNFGNLHFYYASCVVNCVFDCDYCFLKGKYDNNDIIVYANLEDYFASVEAKLSKLQNHEQLYLCVSFDTDLFPLESMLHYIERWATFAQQHNNLKVEVRTKAAKTNPVFWQRVVNQNMIFAFSLSPQEIIDKFEHKTSTLNARLAGVSAALSADANVRLCVDPIIYIKSWEKYYSKLIDKIFSEINAAKIQDVTIGSFRISQSYLKKMRQKYPNNPIAWFPYDLLDGFYQYPADIQNLLESKVRALLLRHIGRNKIFMWNDKGNTKTSTYSNFALPANYFNNLASTNKIISSTTSITEISEYLHCSHSQMLQLRQLINFAKAININLMPVYNYIVDIKLLPSKSKSDTSKALKIIKDYLISSF